jgi:predicted peptidase
LETEGNAINYVALQQGTAVPAEQTDNGGGSHMKTWQIADTIKGIRYWIFKQHK